MSTGLRNTLMISGSIMLASLIALFWVGWYSAEGSVPIADTVLWNKTNGTELQLPIAISRWGDILLGPSCSLVVYIIYQEMSEESSWNNIYPNLIDLFIIFALGTAFGFGFGRGFGLLYILILCIIIFILVQCSNNPEEEFSEGLIFGLGLGLGLGLAFGFITGLAFVLAFGFVLKLLSFIKKFFNLLYHRISVE